MREELGIRGEGVRRKRLDARERIENSGRIRG